MAARSLLLVSLLVLMLHPTIFSDEEHPLEVYQARAEQYYDENVDENALLGLDWNPASALRPGMFAPEFSLMDLDGNMYNLQDQQRKNFVVIHTGNAS